MPSTIAYSLRLLCIALACSFAVLLAAEPPSPLLGSNRDQVVRKLGEPRSQLAVGNRLVMLYARERVVLRDGVVVEVERIFAEPVRRPAPAPVAAPAASAPVAPAVPATAEAAPGAAPNAAAAVPVAAPAVATAAPAVVATAPVAVGTAPVVQATETPAAVPAQPAPPPPPPEPKLEIKLIRPPSASGASAPSTRVAPTSPAAAPVSVPATPSATPSASFATKEAVAPAPAPKEPAAPAATQASAAPAQAPAAPALPKAETAATPATPAVSETPAETPTPAAAEAAEAEEKAKRDAEKAAAVAAEKKAKLIKASRRRLEAVVDDATPVPATSGISTRTYVIAFVTILGCSGYLYWRTRQRKLELAATRVSQTPFGGAAAPSELGGADFNAEFLNKLEWKRFEELVEAYYSKTGVVATRNKGGPASAAQVKIAWKGEPRPFALVRCISHPSDLIEVKPLQELYTLLAAEDIRRGYVVTTGKFSVAARDYAEEKHLTLLPGDIFLEKLNALPGPARTEIMQAASAGDSTTPSCPTCEAKMARSSDVPPVWRCANHPDVTLPT